MRSRRLLVALGVLVLLGAAGVTAKVVHHHQAAVAAQKQRIVQCAAAHRLAATLPAPPAHPAVVVIGDSYSAGYGVPTVTMAWPFLAFPSVAVEAAAGTGFVEPGPCGDESFATHAAAAVRYRPRTVVVQGGINDIDYTQTTIEGAVEKLVRRLSASGSTVIVVGPPLAPAKPAAAVRDVDAALRKAASQTRVQYLSALGWRLSYGPDGLHMTAASHAEFARRVAAAVG